MVRKVGLICLFLLALPAFAHAWTVTAKIGSGSGTVSNGTDVVARPGTYIRGYKAANDPLVANQNFTITPAPGYVVASVVLNGVNVTSSIVDGNISVAAGTPVRNSQSLVVYFTQQLCTVHITQVTGGKITLQRLDASSSPVGSLSTTDLNVRPGTKVRITAMPNSDYKVSNLNGATLPTLYAGDSFYQDTIVNGNMSVPVTFSPSPLVRWDCLIPIAYISPGESLFLDSTCRSPNMPEMTCTYSSPNATDEILTTVPDAPGKIQIMFPTPGVYDLTCTTIVGGQIFTFTKHGFVTVAAHNVCTTCHSNRNSVITTAWQTGAHGTASGHTTSSCQRCHATEGAIAGFAVGYTGGYAEVLSNADAKLAWSSVQPSASSNGISCTVCHAQDPHNGGNILRPVNTYNTVAKAAITWDPNANGKLDQYDVCTGCHSLTNNAGTLVGNYHDGSSASVERTISDSHFDDPTTAVVEGYNLRKAGATPCADCHNLHKADVDIQEEWAESGHAGKIGVAKTDALCSNSLPYYAAAAGAACTDLRPGSTRTYIEDYKRTTTAASGIPSANALLKTIGPDPLEAFVHYNWTQTTGTGNRATCEKCHTATGAANYMSNPAAYVPANNDFSHISGWTAAAGANGKELLYCWGCHSDSQTGALRNPGAVVADYKFQGATAVYPDRQASNICLTCHIGQASGNSITDLTAAGNDFTNVGFVNSHYMAAGALMYVKGGYTNFVPATTAAGTISYGQSLTSDADQTVDVNGAASAGKLTSTHRKLGADYTIHDAHWMPSSEYLALYDNSKGPCVTCHYAGGDHTLKLGQNAIDAVCSQCHEVTDPASLEEFLEVEGSAPFEAAIDLALTELAANYNITYNQSSYPYFYDVSAANGAVKNWTRSNFLATPLSAADAEKLMGACFNINLLKRDPAAYAHARTYARRLLFDTIDFLDDGIIDQSTPATVLASGMKNASGNDVFVQDTTAGGTTTEAYKYLAGYNRTTLTWNAFVRP